MAGKEGGFFSEFVKVSVMGILGLMVIGLAVMTAGLVFEEDILGIGIGDDGESGVNNTTTIPNNTEGNVSGEETENISERVEIINDSLVRENEGAGHESVKVVGTVENVDDEPISTLEVRVRFHDGDGFTEFERASITDLSPEESWEFEISYDGIGESAAKIEDYELRVVE